MNWGDLQRHRTTKSVLLFLLAGLTGWCVFNLQTLSLLKLIERAGIEVLPTLMLVQAACSWGIIKLWGRSSQGSTRGFFLRVLGFSSAVGVFAQTPAMDWVTQFMPAWWVYGAVFIFSQLGVAALRLALHVTFSRRVSVLSNPQISTQLAIAEQVGMMTGILSLLWFKEISGVAGLVALVPFAGSFVALAALGSNGEKENASRPALTIAGDVKESERRMPVFFGWLLALFSVVASLKSLQWFGMAYGLSEASRQGFKLVALFSKLAFIQSALTLVILTASLGFASRIPTWSLGFRVLLGIQAAAAGVLAIFPAPYCLMAAEVVRKVLEHGFLSRSLQLLTSTLPEEHRLESRHLMERWSTTSGTAIAGVLAWFTVQGYLPMSLLWTMAMVIGLAGLVLRRKLFETLCDFHIARLRQSNLGDVLQASQVLANPDCKHHHAALTGLLERNPRPSVKKSLLHALGRMQNPRVVPALLKHLNSDREDIQLAATRAVCAYPGHETDFFLLKGLREMIRSDVPMKISVMKTITERLGRLVVPYLIEVVETPINDRTTANAIEVLGEIAENERDANLHGYLVKFLGAHYPTRIRSNAIVALYRNKKYGLDALEAFDRLLTSDQDQDIDAAAYVASVLNLRGHESFVWERSALLNHANVTLLVALLRLGNPRAPGLLGHWVGSEDETRAMDSLTRLSLLPPRMRAKVFYEIIETAPERIDVVFARMRRSQRDFDSDRGLVRDEAARLGITLHEEEAWLAPLKEAV